MMRIFLKRYSLLILTVAIGIGTFFILSLPHKAFAAGGVGGGGTGSGSGVAGACTGGRSGHWTRCGWGWVKYDIGTPASPGPGRVGPTSGLRNQTAAYNWSSILSTCDTANTKTVYAYIIYDAAFDGMIYDYHSVPYYPTGSVPDGSNMTAPDTWDFPGKFTNDAQGGAGAAGSSQDHGRATSVYTSTVANAYATISNPPYSVPTAGFSFGSNVGWFCYDYAPSDQAATGSLNTSCTLLSGTANDPDRPNDSIGVHVYKGAAGDFSTFVGSTNTDSSGNWSGINISNYRDLTGNTFTAYAIGEKPDGSASNNNPAIGTINTGACLHAVCRGISTNPGSPEPLEPNVVATANFQLQDGGGTPTGIGTSGAGLSYTGNFVAVGVVFSPTTYNPGVPGSGTLSPGGSADFSASATFTAPATGSPSISFNASGIPSFGGCGGVSIPLSTKPYFQTFFSDTRIGSQFYDLGIKDYTPATAAGLKAFNKAGTPNYAGSGSQLGLFVSGTITDFASAMIRSSNPLTPKGLSFTNTAGTYGGSFDGTRQVPNYWSRASTAQAIATVAGGDINNLATGQYYIDHDISLHGTVNNGKRIVLYVEGNVTITNSGSGNGIVYNLSGWSYSTSIPSVYIITKGNIYIDPAVTNTDGVYIALPTSDNSGVFYTCGTPGLVVPPLNAALLVSSCNNQLTINGAVVAYRLKLTRLANTLNAAPTQEVPAIPNTSNPVFTGLPVSRAAEKFVFWPDAWLNAPGILDRDVPDDAIASLPPIL